MTRPPRRSQKGKAGAVPTGAAPRFPGFDSLSESSTWDPVTRATVLGRPDRPGGLRAISAGQEPTFRALLDRLLAQDEEPRVPVAEMIDDRLLRREEDGYRYEDMPEDWEAWPRSVDALDDESREQYGRPFWDLGRSVQLEMLDGARARKGDLGGMPAARVFSLWMRYACHAFYSHPWAWNEIGFGGPAYPRGYRNLGIDRREGWEVAERQPRDPIPWIQRIDEIARRRP